MLIEDEQVVADRHRPRRAGPTRVDRRDRQARDAGRDRRAHAPRHAVRRHDVVRRLHDRPRRGAARRHDDAHRLLARSPRAARCRTGSTPGTRKANGKAVMDYGFHMIVTDARPEVIEELDSMVEQGVTSFKLLPRLPRRAHGRRRHAVRRDGARRRQRRARDDARENGQVIDTLVKRAVAAGNTAPGLALPHAPVDARGRERPSARSRSRRSPDAPLYIVHVTCEEAVDAIARARHAGQTRVGRDLHAVLLPHAGRPRPRRASRARSSSARRRCAPRPTRRGCGRRSAATSSRSSPPTTARSTSRTRRRSARTASRRSPTACPASRSA